MLKFIKGNITVVAENYDAIVNAANKWLCGGGGVDGAIHNAAGPKLMKYCETLCGCETGKAKITPAFNIPCKFIIHAVGPVYDPTKKEECENLLYKAYRSSLEQAQEHNVKKIAFPSISTGIYGFPVRDAARIAISAVKNFLTDAPDMEVTWVLFTDEDYDTYVNEAYRQEYTE